MADNSILSIKNYFTTHNGLQRNNRFKISFENSIPLPGVDSTNGLFANSVTFGTRAIDSVADHLCGYGKGRIIPRTQKFGEGVMVTFPVTNDVHILKYFDAWFNYISSGGRARGGAGNPTTNFVTEYYENSVYNVNMNIELLNPNGNVNATFKFFEVFPLENLPMLMDMSKNNEYLNYSVLFNFREMIIV